MEKQLEEFLASKTKQEKLILYVVVLGMVALFVFQSLYPISKKHLKKAKYTYTKIEKKLRSDQQYLDSLANAGDDYFIIHQIQKSIKDIEKQFEYYQNLNKYIDVKLQSISNIIYNIHKWSHFVNTITKKAKANHIDIDTIHNKFIYHTKHFGHVLEIDLKCHGTYKDTINFIHSIKKSSLIVDIYNIDMNASKLINTSLKVSVWGINY